MLENEKIWILQNILSNIEEHNSAKLLRESLFKIIDGLAPLITASGAGVYTGSITPASTVPVEGDKVFLVTQPGTYTNFGNVVLPENNFGFIFKNGNSFSLQSVEMPTLSAEGKVEEGNTEAVSGGEVYKNAMTKLEYIKNINLYDYTKDIQGKYINVTTGLLVSASDASISSTIDVRNVSKIIIQDRTGSTAYRFIDASGNSMKAKKENGEDFNSYSGANNGLALYKPIGAVGFELTTKFSGTGNPSLIFVNESGSKDIYFDKEITGVKKLEEINEEILEFTSKNKFTDEIIEGYYINTNGLVLPFENSSISELIPIKPNTYYYIQRNPAGTKALVCYDSDKTTKRKVKAINGDEYTSYGLPNLTATGTEDSGPFKTSDTAAFLQIALRFNNTTVSNYDEVMLEEIGEVYDPDFTPSPYQPYNPKHVIKETALPNFEYKVEKQIKILVVGNSFSYNSFCYVPKILSEVCPDLDFVIGIAYDGGSPLVQHYANFTNTTQTLEGVTYTPANYTFLKNIRNNGWNSSAKNIDQILNDDKWDIITFQQGGNSAPLDYDTYYKPYINKLHKLIYDKLNSNIKIGWVSIHGAYSSTTQGLLNNYLATTINTQRVLNETSTSILFPYGTGIQNARTTSLVDIGEGSAKNLMYDNAHLQSGIGELTACYTNALVIINEVYKDKASLIGNKIDVLFDDSLIKYDVLGMTENNRFLAQASAINAIKKPYEVTDISVIETDM